MSGSVLVEPAGAGTTAGPGGDSPPLAAIDVVKHFELGQGRLLRAVDGVSLEVGAGETVALVGESGSGKTTFGRTVVRLHRPTSGRIVLAGVDISRLAGSELRSARAGAQLIFQASGTAFDPRLTVGASIDEPLRNRAGAPRAGRRERRGEAAELLAACGLRPEVMGRYPHELSGGQRQRAAIARALAGRPRLVVADEPTASLDLSTQAQIVNLMLRLQEEERLAFLFITHDIDLAHHLAHRVAVMYLGRIVELATTAAMIETPLHPYAAALVSSSSFHSRRGGRRVLLSGEVPSPIDPPSGCPFRTRCPVASPQCAAERPELVPVGRAGGVERLVACHHPGALQP